MINSLIEGFFLGIGAAIPIGPINILIINEALASYKNAVFIGLGAMSADLTYLSLILLGLLSKIQKSHNILVVMGIMGSVFLIYLSYGIFKNRNIQPEISNSQTYPKDIVGSYFKGYSLTLLNPYTIGFWLSVATYVATNGLNPIFTVLGLIFAITLWITMMPFAVHKSKNLIATKAFKVINIVSSIVLAFFGVSMLVASIALIK